MTISKEKKGGNSEGGEEELVRRKNRVWESDEKRQDVRATASAHRYKPYLNKMGQEGYSHRT